MAITNGYCTLQDVKDVLRITDSTDDTMLELCVESASRLIDGHCERVFYDIAEEARYFFARNSFECEIDDLVSITSLYTAPNGNGGSYDQEWAAAYYQLEPLNGIASGIYRPATLIRAIDTLLFPSVGQEALVKVTGVFGWASVPISIKQAAIMQATRLYKRYDSPLGVLGFGDLGVVRISRVDPDIGALLAPFVKRRFA